MTKKMPCSCEHKFQDKEYGKDIRLHNQTKEDDVWRCTVCLKEKNSK